MGLRERNEEKRSILWWIVTLGASAVILFVAIFFAFDLLASNPLKGTWISEDDAISLEFQDKGVVIVSSTAEETEPYQVELSYVYDKTEKTVDIKAKNDEDFFAGDAADKAELSLDATFGLVADSFNYSIREGVLTLTEREYGEQLVFTKE